MESEPQKEKRQRKRENGLQVAYTINVVKSIEEH